LFKHGSITTKTWRVPQNPDSRSKERGMEYELIFREKKEGKVGRY
jgi:hypothetical protein